MFQQIIDVIKLCITTMIKMARDLWSFSLVSFFISDFSEWSIRKEFA